MKQCIILANGNKPKKQVINFYKNKGFKPLIAADGGANSTFTMKIDPDIIIGDLDSIKPEVLSFYKNKRQIKIIHYKRQNDTDVEKCLKYAIKHKFSKVVLLGATGDRLDHSFCNLGILIKYFNKIEISLIHEKSILKAFTGDVLFNTIPGETISLYGFDEQTKIKSKGLKYPLRNIPLPFGKKESTSNEAKADKVSLKIQGGIIFVIRNFKDAILNDFF